MHAAHILQKAQEWIADTHPRYWTRRGGRDHIWTNVNDEGAHSMKPVRNTRCLPSCVRAVTEGMCSCQARIIAAHICNSGQL